MLFKSVFIGSGKGSTAALMSSAELALWRGGIGSLMSGRVEWESFRPSMLGMKFLQRPLLSGVRNRPGLLRTDPIMLLAELKSNPATKSAELLCSSELFGVIGGRRSLRDRISARIREVISSSTR